MTITTTVAPSVTAVPTRAVGSLSLLPLVAAAMLCVPFLTPAVSTDEDFGWLLAGGAVLLVVVTALVARAQRSARLRLEDGSLHVRALSLRSCTVRLDDVVDAYVTPPPCARGHLRCCSQEGIPTLHLVDDAGTDVAIRTGGWWTDEQGILTGLRLGLRSNPHIDLERAWLLAPPAQISLP